MTRRTSPKPATVPEFQPGDTAPTPSATYLSFYPASVLLPGQRAQLNRAKVFLADTGLYVYLAEPTDPRQADAPTPHWYAAVQYDKTPEPPTGIMARNGIVIPTDSGAVSILPVGGCNCGNRPLKGWTPAWGTVIQAWPAQTGEADA
jgi:hypothetical protein